MPPSRTPSPAFANSPISPVAPYPPLPTPEQRSRAPEFYGFVAWTSTSLLFVLYIIWGLLPEPALEAIGITWYPNRCVTCVIDCCGMLSVDAAENGRSFYRRTQLCWSSSPMPPTSHWLWQEHLLLMSCALLQVGQDTVHHYRPIHSSPNRHTGTSSTSHPHS